MKYFFIVSIVFLCFQISYGQSNLKDIIINKKKVMPSNWMEQIQEKSNWVYVKKVAVKGRKVRDYNENNKTTKEWQFGKIDVNILPFLLSEGDKKCSNFDVKYYPINNTFLLTTMVDFNDNQVERKKVYEVISLTNEYLILEEIKHIYRFDFESGRELSKKEYAKKQKNQPKRMFGGTEINIYLGRPAKIRMILKVKK